MDPLPALEVDAFTTMTLGIVVYFLGARLTAKLPILRAYSIPEPVSGGLLAAVAALGNPSPGADAERVPMDDAPSPDARILEDF